MWMQVQRWSWWHILAARGKVVRAEERWSLLPSLWPTAHHLVKTELSCFLPWANCRPECIVLAVKKRFTASASSFCLHWEMAASQTETVHGLDQSPGQLLDHITLEGMGKAGVVSHYQSLLSALYIESYNFQLSFHTQRTCVKEIFHIFHSHWGKKRKRWLHKKLYVELCMGLIHWNLPRVCMYA